MVQGFDCEGRWPVLGFFQCHPSSCGKLIVTGNPNPDCTGEYAEAGIYNGKVYYTRYDLGFYIWKISFTDQYKISAVLDEPTNYWKSLKNHLLGTYNPNGSSTGNPVVENK